MIATSDSLDFHPSVPSDLIQAVQWYEKVSLELAARFELAVETAFDMIARRPLFCPKYDNETHFVLLTGFPYLLLFRIRSERQYVAGLFHTSTDPNKLQRRLH